jgi:hypothetical protein
MKQNFGGGLKKSNIPPGDEQAVSALDTFK